MIRIIQRSQKLVKTAINKQYNVRVESESLNCYKIPASSLINSAFYSKDVKIESPLSKLMAQETAKESIATDATLGEDKERKEKAEESWRRMKYTLMFFGAGFTCVGAYMIVTLGKPRTDEDGTVIEDKFTTMPLMKQYFYRTLNELYYYRQLIREPSREKLLPDMVKHPYYSPQYTLILEFTDLIVHPEWTYQTGWRFKKRPGLDHFLESLSGIYEIVVYTAEQGMTVFPIIEHLDPKNHINYKLVRDATLFIDGVHVKDLDKLNRDLSRTIVIDWDSDCTKYHPDNVFKIPRWKGNDDDLTLIHLSSFLLAIAQNQIEDIREVVKYYNTYDDPLSAFREKQKKLIDLAEEETAQKQREKDHASPLKRWTPSIFRRNM